MPRVLSLLPTVVVLAMLAGTAAASAPPVVVPDDHPTIQAALDAGARVIQVRDFVPAEDVVITRDGSAGFAVAIEAAAYNNDWLRWVWTTSPRVRSISVVGPCSPTSLTLRGIHFTAAVTLDLCGGALVLERCRFDYYFAGPNRKERDQSCSVRSCTFLGDVTIRTGDVQFLRNAAIDGAVVLESSGMQDIRHNHVPTRPDLEPPTAPEPDLALRSPTSPANHPRREVAEWYGGIGIVVVPDDFPTIQSAIDANADTIQVRDGLTPEDLVVRRHVMIETAPDAHGSSWTDGPSIRSLRLADELDYYSGHNTSVRVKGMTLLGRADLSLCGAVIFEGCRLDSGLTGPGYWMSKTSIRQCLIFGAVRISGYTQFLGNTVIGGKTFIWSDGSHEIRDNFILGPADAGLELSLDCSWGPISGNTIRNTNDGIRVLAAGGTIEANEISDCAGDGIVSKQQNYSGLYCTSNTIKNCGGCGIAIRFIPRDWQTGRAALIDNDIRNCGQDGVRLEWSYAWPVTGNVILDCGGYGFLAHEAPDFQNNVIGRNGLTGVEVNGMPALYHNTIFGNGGGGMRVWNGYFSQLTHNIFAFNHGFGLVVGGPHPVFSSCNDWFGNGTDAVNVLLDATDRYLDPSFCGGLGGTDGHLSSSSALLTSAVGYCGLIGARGQGCASATTAVPIASASMSSLRAWPVPSRGAVNFSIPLLNETADLEIFDITGARRWQSTLPAGTSTARWDRRQSNGVTAAPGVYFARLRQGSSEIERVRVVLTE